MESRLHSRVLSARLTQAFNIHNVSRCETVKDGVKGEERDSVRVAGVCARCEGKLTGYPTARQ